jgi:hypothetical protein
MERERLPLDRELFPLHREEPQHEGETPQPGRAPRRRAAHRVLSLVEFRQPTPATLTLLQSRVEGDVSEPGESETRENAYDER